MNRHFHTKPTLVVVSARYPLMHPKGVTPLGRAQDSLHAPSCRPQTMRGTSTPFLYHPFLHSQNPKDKELRLSTSVLNVINGARTIQLNCTSHNCTCTRLPPCALQSAPQGKGTHFPPCTCQPHVVATSSVRSHHHTVTLQSSEFPQEASLTYTATTRSLKQAPVLCLC